jgi:DNA repair exonuclease SbcCD ATPase subunit/DNA repair exonuclease SbcCD nuclease subunit
MEYYIVKSDDEQIKYIAHLADIHIKYNNERDEEYKQVFNKLYAKLKSLTKLGNTLIVISGDLYDYRTQHSPYSIKTINDFLTNLTNIAPVITIVGNHDCNMSNKKSLDSITPFLNIPKKNEIHNFVDSGLYLYNNIVFNVCSIFDNKIIQECDIKKIDGFNNKISIALYHNSIEGATVDNNYKPINEHFSISDFSQFDYAFLGHIHKYQILGNKKNVCYPSSLIQQNYGEASDKHGFVIWDIIDKKKKFIEIQNDYGYFTINIENGQVINNKELSKFPTIRLRSRNTDIERIDKIERDYKDKYNILKVDYDIAQKFISLSQIENPKLEIIEKLRSKMYEDIDEYEQLLLTSIFGYTTAKEIKITDKNKINITKFHHELFIDEKNIIKSENNQKWTIKKITFSNMYCFKENNTINLENATGIIGIIGPNHIGKSAIIDTIAFAIFGTCSRDEDFMNKDSKTCQTDIEIKLGDDTYQIIRSCIKNGKTKIQYNKKVKIIKKNKNGQEEIQKDRITDNENLIASIFGNYEDIERTSFTFQDNATVIGNTSKKKGNLTNQKNQKENLTTLLNINFFDKLNKLASGKLTELNCEVKAIKKNIEIIKDKYTNENLKISKDNLKKIETKYNELITEKDKLTTDYENKLLQISKDLPKDIPEKEITKIKYKKCIEKIKQIKQQLQNSDKNIDKLNTSIIENKKIIDNINYNELQEEKKNFENNKITKNNKYKNKILELQKKIIQTNIKNQPLQNLINKKNNITEEITNNDKLIKPTIEKIKILEGRKIKVDSVDYKNFNKLNDEELNLKNNLNILNGKIENLKIKINEIEKQQNIIIKLEFSNECEHCKKNKAFISNGGGVRMYKSLTTDYDNLVIEQKDKTTKLNEITNNIISIKKIIEQNENNNKIDEQIEHLKKDIIILTEKKKNYNLTLENVNNEIDILNKNIEIEENNKILENKITNLTNKSNNVSNELFDKDNILNDYNEAINSNISINEKINKLTNDKFDFISTLNKKRNKKKTLESNYEFIKKLSINNKIINECDIIKESITKLNYEINKINNEIINTKVDIQKCEDNIINYNNLIEKERIINEDIETAKIYIDITGLKGVSQYYLELYLPILQDEINEALKNIDTFSVNLKIDNDKIILSKNINKDILNIASCSGFEKAIVNILFKLVIAKRSNVSMPNFLMMDEILTSFDGHFLENLSNLFNYIKNNFAFTLFITHIDTLKNYCNDVITIDNDNGYSSVNHIL